jgi:hypothetical protein
VAKHHGQLLLWVNGNICPATSIVNATASMTNANAIWTIGKRADGTNIASKARISMLRFCKSVIPDGGLMTTIASEELRLIRRSSSCLLKGAGPYLEPFYDPINDSIITINSLYIMEHIGLEVVNSYKLSDYGISGTIKKIHKVHKRVVAITDSEIFVHFGETRFDRFKVEYLEARDVNNTNVNHITHTSTKDNTPKQTYYFNMKHGTVMYVGVEWKCLSHDFIPNTQGNVFQGSWGYGTIGGILSRELDGNVSILPDVADANAWRWTEIRSEKIIVSNAALKAVLKTNSVGFYVEVVGLAATYLNWEIKISTSFIRNRKDIHPIHVPGGHGVKEGEFNFGSDGQWHRKDGLTY